MESCASLFIAGQDRNSASNADVINPYSGKAVWTYPSASAKDCDDTVDALAAYQPAWEKVPLSQKRAIFVKAADLICLPKYADRIDLCMAKEIDATSIWRQFGKLSAHRYLMDVASQAAQLQGQTVKSEKPDCDLFMVQRRAAGVVLGIAPWNAPVQLAIRAIGYALMAGNTVILKASEYSPASQRIVMDLMLEAGLPPNAMAFLIFGRKTAAELTTRLIARKEIRRVNFTGSDVVGKLIAAQCGQHLKQCIVELGGKAPVIVSKHAADNLQSAASGVVYGALVHSGQVCMSTERVLVQREIYEQFEKLVSEKVKNITAGDTTTAHLGSLFTPASAQNVVMQIMDASKKGAKVLTGQASERAEGENGTLVQPIVLGNVTKDMLLWRRESFGPVIAITPFDTMDEAIALANDSEYSLSAGIWTSDLQEAMSYAPQIRAASVQVNGATVFTETSVGHTGLGGASGYGRFNIDAFSDLRAIAFHSVGAKFPAF